MWMKTWLLFLSFEPNVCKFLGMPPPPLLTSKYNKVWTINRKNTKIPECSGCAGSEPHVGLARLGSDKMLHPVRVILTPICVTEPSIWFVVGTMENKLLMSF